MIKIKNKLQIEQMQSACRIAANALSVAGEMIRPGITTREIDLVIRKYITSHNAVPSFLNYNGFPASACISVNEEVIHGIPGSRKLCDGDIIGIDVGAFYNGFHGDTAATFPVGRCDPDSLRLLQVTKDSLQKAIEIAGPDKRVGDVSQTVQSFVEGNGFSVVRDFCGHGVGEDLHEEPSVPNYGRAGRGTKLFPGMTIAIEPMVNQGVFEVFVLDNDWTVVTADGKRSAHFEHTVLITSDGAVPLSVAG